MSKAPNLPESTGPEDDALRIQALRRSWACPGAGFAMLGRDGLAISTYLASLATLGAMAWLIIQPAAAALWATLGFLALAAALSLTEQFTVKKLSPQSPKPTFLVRGFLLAGAAQWLAAAVVLALFVIRFGSLQMAGSGMSPTLEKGERLLYEKRVEPERLRRGAAIVYRVSDRSAWGEPGWLVISRILAVPGDQLSLRDGTYLVNGEAGPAVAATGQYEPVIHIPSAPKTLLVPVDLFFVVQDSPRGGFDSRVLSWVQTRDVVSTRLYYLSRRGVLKPVE
jgi:signal peptidase I